MTGEGPTGRALGQTPGQEQEWCRACNHHTFLRQMSQQRNTAADALRPLTARSVIASLLLGMHPPHASATLLVRWARLLGFADGTARAALSRMVAAGELVAHEGRYELAGGLRTRQGPQDWALDPVLAPWDGRWLLYVVQDGPRRARDRAEFRAAARTARLGEQQRRGVAAARQPAPGGDRACGDVDAHGPGEPLVRPPRRGVPA